MKHRLLILSLLLLTLLPARTTAAQQAPNIESLSIDFWPDYDREAVLVLITGTLSQPGEVSLPFPESADFHVLARIDADGVMIDDLDAPAFANGRMTFATPDPRFRVEYYLPYTRSGSQRSFSYTWPADVPVSQLLVSVQQPAAATEMNIDPEPAGQVRNQDDGLIYYNLPALQVAAGQSASFVIDYVMASDVLTFASNPPPVSGGSDPTGAAVSGSEGTPIWVLALVGAGLLLIVAATTWQVATYNNRRVRKPKPRRSGQNKRAAAQKGQKQPSAARRAAKFCHECGEATTQGDRFCRSCGTALKR